MPNHNVRYILPLSPGLMGLGVMGLLGTLRSEDSASRLNWRVVAFLVVWLAAKVVFVEVVVPWRSAGRHAEATAAQLRELVPPGEVLHLGRLKDEGIMFYYGRPAWRCHDPRQLPRPAYLVLIQQEWNARADWGDVELIQWMYDQQGDPIILVRAK